MEGNIERECSALGGLFQQIINDMKVSYKFHALFILTANAVFFSLTLFALPSWRDRAINVQVDILIM